MIQAPRMLLIGSTGRNAGKTGLAAEIIRRFSGRLPVVGVKVTAIDERNGRCPRGGRGCGVCSSLTGEFCITDEKDAPQGKDTRRLADAGAARVYWLRVLKSRLEEGARALLETIGGRAWVVCESNSLRTVLEPGLFLMVTPARPAAVKPSAAAVLNRADATIPFDGAAFGFDIDNVTVTDTGWRLLPMKNTESFQSP